MCPTPTTDYAAQNLYLKAYNRLTGDFQRIPLSFGRQKIVRPGSKFLIAGQRIAYDLQPMRVD